MARLLSNLQNLIGIVVDEVHLTYKWGMAEKGQKSAFRECFARLGELRSIVKPVIVTQYASVIQKVARRQLQCMNWPKEVFLLSGQ
ncbi:hypothetical protein WMY93_000016 [Mugilogobius chulae]|uniref:Helicase ATP-binding domain-containing protein n=1 Tax=Mugilogobius chulae TaxID=88201 RepID=A0AAW0PZ41_9GOBI